MPICGWRGGPFLYTVSAKLGNGEETSARFGCRKFEFDPQKGFILNGRGYRCAAFPAIRTARGRHCPDQRNDGGGHGPSILEMGANTIRLAHYQHAQYFYDLCDEKGLVIWAEIPYITMHMTNGRANTLTQMEELIVQNYNHPCIAVWGLSNEITAASAVNEGSAGKPPSAERAGTQAGPHPQDHHGKRVHAGDHQPHSGDPGREQLQPLLRLVSG